MKTILSFISVFLFILMTGCQTNQSEKDVSSGTSDTTSASGLTGDSVKLVKTASILLKVKDIHLATRAVSELARRLGGLISHQTMESAELQTEVFNVSDDSILLISSYSPGAEITLRVPSQNLEECMNGFIELGYFTSSIKMDIDDKSLDYLANNMKQQNRVKFISGAGKDLKDSAGIRLVTTNDQIIEQETIKRQINADVNFSTIQLKLYQNTLVKREVVADYDLSNYKLPFGRSFINALSDGWKYFVAFIILLARLWAFIIAAILCLIIFRYYHYKRKLVHYSGGK